jgi:hypothetical protein
MGRYWDIEMMKYSLLMLMLLAGAGCGQDWNAYAQGWMNLGQYNDASYRDQYYPYFGEDFFTSGYDPYESSPAGIDAERRRFESPFLPYFGDLFLSQGEPYRFSDPGPWVVYPLYPYDYYNYPYENRPVMKWPAFQKNWTSTLNYAKANSSFRVLGNGYWSTV